MQCNSCLIPKHLVHDRQYREELEERTEQDVAAHEEAQHCHNFIRERIDTTHLHFVARSIMF